MKWKVCTTGMVDGFLKRREAINTHSVCPLNSKNLTETKEGLKLLF